MSIKPSARTASKSVIDYIVDPKTSVKTLKSGVFVECFRLMIDQAAQAATESARDPSAAGALRPILDQTARTLWRASRRFPDAIPPLLLKSGLSPEQSAELSASLLGQTREVAAVLMKIASQPGRFDPVADFKKSPTARPRASNRYDDLVEMFVNEVLPSVELEYRALIGAYAEVHLVKDMASNPDFRQAIEDLASSDTHPDRRAICMKRLREAAFTSASDAGVKVITFTTPSGDAADLMAHAPNLYEFGRSAPAYTPDFAVMDRDAGVFHLGCVTTSSTCIKQNRQSIRYALAVQNSIAAGVKHFDGITDFRLTSSYVDPLRAAPLFRSAVKACAEVNPSLRPESLSALPAFREIAACMTGVLPGQYESVRKSLTHQAIRGPGHPTLKIRPEQFDRQVALTVDVLDDASACLSALVDMATKGSGIIQMTGDLLSAASDGVRSARDLRSALQDAPIDFDDRLTRITKSLQRSVRLFFARNQSVEKPLSPEGEPIPASVVAEFNSILTTNVSTEQRALSFLRSNPDQLNKPAAAQKQPSRSFDPVQHQDASTRCSKIITRWLSGGCSEQRLNNIAAQRFDSLIKSWEESGVIRVSAANQIVRLSSCLLKTSDRGATAFLSLSGRQDLLQALLAVATRDAARTEPTKSASPATTFRHLKSLQEAFQPRFAKTP